jgi:hypothetical protein
MPGEVLIDPNVVKLGSGESIEVLKSYARSTSFVASKSPTERPPY